MSEHTLSIISIGEELLLGLTLDSNAQFLCRRASELGWRVRTIRTVGDSLQEIQNTIKSEATRNDALLLTGGLGPTEDDRTRFAIAAVLGETLSERPDLIEQIEARFRHHHWPMRAINRVQAMLPTSAIGIPNPHGTAPGIRVNVGTCEVFAMPGVPREMRAMFDDTVAPHLSVSPDLDRQCIRQLHLFGIGESTVGETIQDLMRESTNPQIGTAVQHGIITVRLLARGPGTAAENLLAPVEAELRNRLAAHLHGCDGETLATAVVSSLDKRGETLACAESCTGGIIADQLVSVPGASNVLIESIVCYANDSKIRRLGVSADDLETHGTVSHAVVCAMARGIRETSGATYGLAVSGIAGPGGGTPDKPVGTVWIALASPSDVIACKRLFGSDRYGNRLRAAHVALDLLRRVANGIDIPWEVHRGG